jgi:hypothetical protein
MLVDGLKREALPGASFFHPGQSAAFSGGSLDGRDENRGEAAGFPATSHGRIALGDPYVWPPGLSAIGTSGDGDA